MKKIKGKKITAGLTSLFLITVLVITGCIGLTGCGSSDPSQTINVFNWGEYIDEDLLRDFEDETGIKVNYTTVATCEEMYAKMNPAKAEILKQLEAQTKGIEMKAAAPFVMQAMRELRSRNLSFTPEETEAMMEILTRDMNDSEKQRVEKMKQIIRTKGNK